MDPNPHTRSPFMNRTVKRKYVCRVERWKNYTITKSARNRLHLTSQSHSAPARQSIFDHPIFNAQENETPQHTNLPIWKDGHAVQIKNEFWPFSITCLACVWQRLSNVDYFVRHGCKTTGGHHSICYRLVGVFALIIKPFWINHLKIKQIFWTCCRSQWLRSFSFLHQYERLKVNGNILLLFNFNLDRRFSLIIWWNKRVFWSKTTAIR